MTRIVLVYFNAGGGHRAAAEALHEVMLQTHPGWQVDKLNLVDLVDPGEVFRRVTGMAPEDLYNKRLASGFTLGMAQELKLLQCLIRLSHRSLVQRLVQHWRGLQPDMVVSLIPNFNRALHDSLALARPAAAFVTVMTDMADHPPHFWAEPGLRQHLVCGTGHAAAQALLAGVEGRYVHCVSGMILRPGFYVDPLPDRTAARKRAGLDARTPTGLVLFGGTGARVMQHIAARLPDTPLILMCGRNPALAATIRSQATRAPRIVLGYTLDVARWMQLADFFIGKPGPGSLSEAVQMGLPVVVTRNASTMPQERWNTEWVQRHGLGVVLRRFRDVQAAVDTVVRRLPEWHAGTQRMNNRAVFEVPQILQRILTDAASESPSRQGCLDPEPIRRSTASFETAPRSEAMGIASIGLRSPSLHSLPRRLSCP